MNLNSTSKLKYVPCLSEVFFQQLYDNREFLTNVSIPEQMLQQVIIPWKICIGADLPQNLRICHENLFELFCAVLLYYFPSAMQ